VVGLLCPLPLRLAERTMRSMKPGDLLVLRGDDPALRVDVPAWCVRNGHRLVELSEDGSLIRAVVEKRRASISHGES